MDYSELSGTTGWSGDEKSIMSTSIIWDQDDDGEEEAQTVREGGDLLYDNTIPNIC